MAPRYAELARQNLATAQDYLAQAPMGFGQWLVAVDYALSRPFEIAIVGPPTDQATRQLLGVATAAFRPRQVGAYGPGGVMAAAVLLLQDRGLVKRQAAAYVCRDFICQAPVTDPPALEQLLGVN